MLLDSGSSATIVTRRISILTGNCRKNNKTTQWQTTAGKFLTVTKTQVKFHLDEFLLSKKVEWSCHVSTTPLLEYDMIMGRDLLLELGINLKFETKIIEWEGVEIDMPNFSTLNKGELNDIVQELDEPKLAQQTRTRATKILDAVYRPGDLNRLVTDNNSNLNLQQRTALLEMLRKKAVLFDGTL